MRALVPNPDGVLKPGEFVRVVAVFPDFADAVLVPERAVLEEQGGSYVLVVKRRRRRSSTGACAQASRTTASARIVEGLAAGERVIVDGVQKARPGTKVTPRAESAEAS